MTNSFNLESAKSYWRHAPSGEGKHNTAELARLPDAELQRLWDRAFISRFLRYPEEDSFVQVMAASLRNKRVLSVGSGMGFHELYYQRYGAEVTCCDIVPSNLEIIRRVCAIKRLPTIRTILSSDASRETFTGPYDVGFVYGSLMAMPSDEQRSLLARLKSALLPNGQIVLMLYTWKFAASTCGWKSPGEFDPLVFARASDPSVEGEHCPWSDWHDGAKLLNLAGSGMRISRQQLWQQGLFVWFALEFGEPDAAPTEFFNQTKHQEYAMAAELPINAFQPAAARMTVRKDGLLIESEEAPFGYALVSPQYEPAMTTMRPNALIADITLLEGGVSIGLLDVSSQSFLNTATLTDLGRHNLIVPLPREISRYQVILSNHRNVGCGASSFVLHRAQLAKRASVTEESWG